MYFAQGSRSMAMSKLRVPTQKFSYISWGTLRSGLFLGIAFSLIAVTIVCAVYSDDLDIPRARKLALFRIFRGLFVFAVFPLLLTVNFYIFAREGINFRLMMGISLRNHRALQAWKSLLAIGSSCMAVWAVGTIVFSFSPMLGSSMAAWSPVVVCILMIHAVTQPIYHFRAWEAPLLLKLFGRILLAPFYEVHFADFWAADQLCSLVRPLLDLEFAVYYLIHRYNSGGHDLDDLTTEHRVLRGILASLPYTWRLLQCLRRYADQRRNQRGRSLHPHLTNACKYASAYPVIWFSLLANHYKGSRGSEIESSDARTYFVLWVVFAIANTAYTMAWDFFMDWGIFTSWDVPLRPNTTYPTWAYVAAIIFNIFGRVAWVLSISIGFFGDYAYSYLDLGLACIEILRRISWNFFRFELEHQVNCGRLRPTYFELAGPQPDKSGAPPKRSSVRSLSRAVVEEMSFPELDASSAEQMDSTTNNNVGHRSSRMSSTV